MSDFSIDQVILFTQFGCDLFERLVGRNSLTWMIRGHHARIPSVDLRFVDGHLDHIRVDAPGDQCLNSRLVLGSVLLRTSLTGLTFVAVLVVT